MLPCFLFLYRNISPSLVSLRSARRGFALPPLRVSRRPSRPGPTAPLRPLAAAASSGDSAAPASAHSRVRQNFHPD